MQIRLLALLLLQPERSWALQELASALDAPASSVHRELMRAIDAGLVVRDTSARPHDFRAASEDSLFEPLAELLRRSVGVEEQLRKALEVPGVTAALIHGSWAGGARRPDSDIDVLVVGDVGIRALRRRVRPIGKAVGRNIDLTVVSAKELRRLRAEDSGFLRGLTGAPVVELVGDREDVVGS